MIILVLAGEGIFLLPFVLPRLFKPTMLEVFEMDNTQLGFLFSAYGLVAIPAYLFGGPIADRFAPNRLMALALLLTALGGVFMSFIPETKHLFWIYGLWGMTTIFLFWAALFRTTRLVSGESNLGASYGVLDGGRGLTAALIGLGAVWVLSFALPGDLSTIPHEEKTQALKTVILFFTGFVLFLSVLVWFGLAHIGKIEGTDPKRFSLVKIKKSLKLPEVWLQALIILCAYSGYRVTDDFSLLAKDVLGYNDVQSAFVGTLALWLRSFAAVSAGFMADKTKPSTVMIICFLSMIFSGIMMGIGMNSFFNLSFIIVVISSTCLGVYAMRGLYFAIMGESKIPLEVTGTIVGLASVIGYLPDIFMAPLMGYFLDGFSGVNGHRLVFLLLVEFALIGLLAVAAFKYLTGKRSHLTSN